jgi:hypothetical protein
MNSQDHKQLAELFSRTTKGGTDATAATRLFNEKASALGLDSFKLYNSFVQGGSLTVYEPQQPPKTQTSTGKPGAGRWPDTVKVRIFCANVDKGSIATFKMRTGSAYYDVQSVTKEIATTNGSAGQAAISADFPASLLDWGKSSCPYCGGQHRNERFGPVHCGQCGKLRCHSGIYRKGGRERFRCVCGSDAEFVSGGDEIKLDLATEARPNVTATKPRSTAASSRPALPPISSPPALPAAYDPIALPAPGRRR